MHNCVPSLERGVRLVETRLQKVWKNFLNTMQKISSKNYLPLPRNR